MPDPTKSGPIEPGGLTLRQETSDDLLLVEGYGDGGFRLMGHRFEGGILVMSSGVFPVGAIDLESLTIEDIAPVLEADEKPDLILFGTGERLLLLPPLIKSFLDKARIGYDSMDSGAAARTYNVLMLEGRRVAALLLPVE